MSSATPVERSNGGAPSVYTNRLDLSQAWYDALYDAGARRTPTSSSHASLAKARTANRTDATRVPSDDVARSSDGRLRDARTGRIPRTASREIGGSLARIVRPTSRIRTSALVRPARTPAIAIVIHGRGGLALRIAYSTSGLAIAARGGDALARAAIERAHAALVSRGIAHRVFSAQHTPSEDFE